jgi:hypothetical protein
MKPYKKLFTESDFEGYNDLDPEERLNKELINGEFDPTNAENAYAVSEFNKLISSLSSQGFDSETIEKAFNYAFKGE